jgi:hypothetical protein
VGFRRLFLGRRAGTAQASAHAPWCRQIDRQIDVPAVWKFEIPLEAPIAPFDHVSGAIGETAGETIDQAHDTSLGKMFWLTKVPQLKFPIEAAVPIHLAPVCRFLWVAVGNPTNVLFRPENGSVAEGAGPWGHDLCGVGMRARLVDVTAQYVCSPT